MTSPMSPTAAPTPSPGPSSSQAPQTVYVNNATATNSVSAFRLGNDGVLSPVAGSPFASGGTSGGFEAIAVSGDGRMVFASNSASNNVSSFSVDASTGSLIPVSGSPFALGGATNLFPTPWMAVSPDNRFLLVAKNTEIAVLAIQANGSLASVPGSPFPTAEGAVLNMKLLPNGGFVFVSETTGGKPPTNVIQAFRLDSTGTLSTAAMFLTHISGKIDADGPEFLEANCASNLLFASEGGVPVAIDVFNIANDASLNLASRFEMITNTNLLPFGIVLSPDERFLFLANGGNDSTNTLMVAANGALSELPGNPWFPLNTGQLGPHAIAVNASGTLVVSAVRELFTSIGRQFLVVQQVHPDGALGPPTGMPVTIGQGGQQAIAVSPPKHCNV
jgi:6-phosphogluconolactonase (cycloisomerase 2 family)